MKAFPGTSVKLEHHCDLLNEESLFEYFNETVDSPTLELVDVLVPIGPVGLEEKNSPT